MGVHPTASIFGERLGHECGVHVSGKRHLFNDGAECHYIIGGLQGVGVTQVDLVLPGAGFVVAELHRNADLFQHGHRITAEILHNPAGCVVEIRLVVHRDGEPVSPQLRGFKEVELDLG